METLKIYAINDVKSRMWSSPITDTSSAFHRYMSFLVNDSNNEYSKFPHDFVVFELGEYDPLSGQVMLHPDKAILNTLAEYVLVKEETTNE